MMILIWLKNNWRLVTGIAMLAVSFFTGWKLGADSVQSRWDKEQANEMRILNDALTANDATINKLEQERKNAEIVIDGFMSRKPDSVPLPRPAKCSEITTASGGNVTIQPDRDVFAEAEGILGEDRRRTQEIIGAAEHELNECRVVKQWAQSLIQSP